MKEEQKEKYIEILEVSDGVLICTTKKLDEEHIELNFLLENISPVEIGEAINYLIGEYSEILQYTIFKHAGNKDVVTGNPEGYSGRGN